jgi:ArsR family transcriptional regulator, arsenate/arsenite/antimonite-responsive transcriptional repressor
MVPRGCQSTIHFHIIGNMDSTAAVTALAALAQPSRLAIFRLLVQAGPAGLSAGRIGESLSLPPATLSFHLKELSHAGLTAYRPEGRFVIHSAQFDAMNALLAYLTENCCGGQSCCEPAPTEVPAPATTARRRVA